MADKISVLFTEEEVNARIREMGEQISRDYAGKSVHLVGILKGATFFACELAKRIKVPVTIDFMSVSSYGDSTESSGVVKITKDLDEPLEGKDVLVVEDIVDTFVPESKDEETMEIIFKRYSKEIGKDIKELFFLCKGDLVNPEKSINELNDADLLKLIDKDALNKLFSLIVSISFFKPGKPVNT